MVKYEEQARVFAKDALVLCAGAGPRVRQLMEELVLLCRDSRKHAIGLLNWRGGRVYLSAAGLSRFIHRSKCGRCSSGFGLEAISFAATDSKRRCQSGCRITRRNTNALALPLQEKQQDRTTKGVALFRRLRFVKTRLATIGHVSMDDPALSSFVYR